MDKKTKEALSTLQGKKAGVFYDDSNMFYAAKKNDWKVDVIKLKKFLSQYCKLQFFNYYVAVPKKSDPHYKDTNRFLDKIKPHVTLKKKDLRYIKDYCKRHGHDLIDLFTDAGVSAIKERPEFEKMMETISEDGASEQDVEGIVVTKLDRFGRLVKDLVINMETLQNQEIDFISIGDSLDTQRQAFVSYTLSLC